jgi:hypothetical protein
MLITQGNTNSHPESPFNNLREDTYIRMGAEKDTKQGVEKPMTETEFKGKVSAIDPAVRILTMKDESGAPYIFKWTEPLDVVMNKWRTGYYLTLKYESDTYFLKNATYWQEGKDQWPKGQQGSGGRPYTPKNDKPMAYESAFRSCVELVRDTDFPGMAFAERVEAVRKEADKIGKWIVTEGGAA